MGVLFTIAALAVLLAVILIGKGKSGHHEDFVEDELHLENDPMTEQMFEDIDDIIY